MTKDHTTLRHAFGKYRIIHSIDQGRVGEKLPKQMRKGQVWFKDGSL